MISLGSSNRVSVLCHNHKDKALPYNFGFHDVIGDSVRAIFEQEDYSCVASSGHARPIAESHVIGSPDAQRNQ